MPSEAPEWLSYQHMLRALGAYLDREQPLRFRLLEVLDGFTLILDHGGQVQQVQFERPTLAEQVEQLMRGRRLLGSKYQACWRLMPTGHQDFLRALGFELDESQAQEVLLDELDDGLLLSYSYLDPGRGYQWRKHMVVMQEKQMTAILEAAWRRRVRRGLLHR